MAQHSRELPTSPDAGAERRDQLLSGTRRGALNEARLRRCAGPHAFTPAHPLPGERSICSRCGGTVSPPARFWYEQGLAHGQRSPTPSKPRGLRAVRAGRVA